MVQDGFTLKGRTIAVTRPSDQAEDTANLIKQFGGKPYFISTILIKPKCNSLAVKQFVRELENNQIDYVIFMSPNGIRHLLNCAENLGLRDKLKVNLKKSVVIAVGPKTAKDLKIHGMTVDLVPEKYSSSGIIQILEQQGISCKTIYIPRTSHATPNLKNSLEALGAIVHELYVYESLVPANKMLNEKFLKDLRQGKINAIIFGSSLSAKNLFKMLKELIPKKKLRDLVNKELTIVAIGPVTAKTLSEIGLRVDVMPTIYLFEEAIKELSQYWTVRS